jgi:hypothetical protein
VRFTGTSLAARRPATRLGNKMAPLFPTMINFLRVFQSRYETYFSRKTGVLILP